MANTVNTLSFDAIIIGGGGAGMRAALQAGIEFIVADPILPTLLLAVRLTAEAEVKVENA
jgi:succinate dehydrogenase/fumarate reductase flavoprotein subunit